LQGVLVASARADRTFKLRMEKFEEDEQEAGGLSPARRGVGPLLQRDYNSWTDFVSRVVPSNVSREG
jgi:hypothetical protein